MSYIAKFNPYSMADETIMSVATGRKELLSKVLKELNNNLTSDSVPQHLLIRGPRGMGKSFFMKYLQINFRRTETFQNCEFLLLPEEQNNLNSPSDLIKLILGELTGHSGEMTTLWDEPADVWQTELEKLKDYLAAKRAEKEDYLLVVVVENLDEFLRNIQTDKKTRKVYESRFRHLIEKVKYLSVIGATPRIDPEAIDGDYNSRLFHAFKKCTLRRWKEEDYFRYFDRRQAMKEEETGRQFSREHTSLMRAKLKALSHYTGGSPRMAVVLTNLLLEDDVLSTVKTLFGLIDDLTPYYQDLTKSIPKKSKILFDTLIRKGENLSQSELAEIVGATQSKISKAFLWLKDNGYIVGRKRTNSPAFSYWVSDRIHVLYYQLREIHHNKNITPIWLLSDFLVAIYQEKDLRNYADKYLREQPSHEANDMAKVYLLAAGMLEKEELLEMESDDWLTMVGEVPEENERINEILREMEGYAERYKEEDFIDAFKENVEIVKKLLGKVTNEKILSKYLFRYEKMLTNFFISKDFYNSSIIFFSVLLQFREKQKNIDRIGAIHLALGFCKGNLKELESAVEHCKEAINCFKITSSSHEERIAFHVLTESYLINQEIDKAFDHYKLYFNKYKNNLDLEWIKTIGRTLGNKFSKKGNYQNAIKLFSFALKINEHEDNISEQAYYKGQLGWNLGKLNEHKEAIEFHKSALILREKEKNNYGQAWNLGRIGWNIQKLNRFEESITFFQKALEIYKEEKNIQEQIWISGRLGLSLQKIGLHKKAINLHKRALALSIKEKNVKEQALNLERIGWNFKEIGEHMQAIEFHQQALEIWIKEDNPSVQAWNIGHIGENYILLGEWEKAVSLLHPSFAENEIIFKEFGDAIIFTEKKESISKAFNIGIRLLKILKEQLNWINIKRSLCLFFANLLNMRISKSLFKDLCNEAFSIFPDDESQIIINAALHTVNYVESGKDAAYLEKLDPDMAIALKAIVEAGKL